MTVPVLSAARHLARRSGYSLSNLELQKLLYLAHMFYMGRMLGEPLIPGVFEAWDYGPVHPELYSRARVFGSNHVQDVFGVAPEIEGGAEAVLLDEAYDNLGHAGPGRLVNVTHRPGGAWDINYVPGQRHCIIPNADILLEYRQLEAQAHG